MNTPPPNTYTPGYARCKMALIAYGLLLMTLGFSHVWTPLRLVICGNRALAEATRVIKTKPGLPDKILSQPAHVRQEQETRDRSYLFWNEFKFLTNHGQTVHVKAPIASLLKPLYPLTDADGLPTTDLVYYDPNQPEVVTFPLIVSTWFSSGILILVGTLAVLIGSTLLYWANKPIELPHLNTAPSKETS